METFENYNPSKRKLKDPTTLRVFFSSPFGGLEEEREELTRKYFPQFNHACKDRGIQFVPVDMRWGITLEAAANSQVINICLREIDRSDIFIGFFGQRYGWHGESDESLQQNFDNVMGTYPWLADVRDKSVTELEFLHGHLNNPGQLPTAICFRDKAYDDAVRDDALAKGDKKNVFKYSAESEHSVELMEDLKRRVRETEPQCLGLLMNYKNPHEGAKFMFDSVWEVCQELLAGSESDILSPLQQNRLIHDAYIASRCTLYLGGDDYLKELDSEKLKEHPKVLVKGPAGSGKSALLANLVKKIQNESNSISFIYYFIGCAQGTTKPKSILQHILSELKHINGTEEREKNENESSQYESRQNQDIQDIFVSVQNEMEQASSNGKNILIILDGLNSVTNSEKTARHLFWLPEKYPSGISLVVSSLSSDVETVDLLVKERGFYDLEIEPLPKSIQGEMSEKTLMINGKELSPHQLQRIVEAEQTKNPLFLKIVLSEISIYGYFRLLDKKIDSLIGSVSVKELLSKVLQRLEEDYNVKDYPGSLVQQVLSAIAVSHEGLSETELLDMFNIESHIWSPFYFAMENFLISHQGLLRFAFSELQEAVEERYLTSQEQRFAVVGQLINYFDNVRKKNNSPNNLFNMAINRVAGELPWLQSKIEDKEGLMNTLTDVSVFCAVNRKSEYGLIDLLAATSCNQDQICDALLKAFDMAVSDVYDYQQERGTTQKGPPGYVLLPVLNSMEKIFNLASWYTPKIRLLQRTIQILEGIEGKINEDERQTLLRDHRYFLACAYVDDMQYEKGQQLHETVMKECQQLLQDSDDPRIKQTLAYTYNGLGVIHLRQNHSKESEPMFLASIKIHEELGNDLSVAESKMSIGVIKMNAGMLDEAMEYYHTAMKIFENIYFGHLPLVVGNLLTNMAVCYRRMGHVEKAESMYMKSLEVKANAVGWHHEVIAACYLNLGSLESSSRENYAKGEEYTKKAIEILELNEVKLEQSEMWQSLENLVLNLICQNKHEEALPVFQRVFAMQQRENKIYQCTPTVHREMVRFMISKGMLDEAANVAICHINSPNVRHPTTYILLDQCDKQRPEEERPQRPREQTVTYALQELWPGSNDLTGYVIQSYVLPSDDLELFKKMIHTMDEKNPGFEWTSYKVGAIWCEDANKLEAAVDILKTGLEKYPDTMGLKTKLFDCYRALKWHREAYPLLKELLENDPDNQSLMLVGGEIAFNCDDSQLALELWERVAVMPDENLAQMAKNILANVKKQLVEADGEGQGESHDNGTEDASEGKNNPQMV